MNSGRDQFDRLTLRSGAFSKMGKGCLIIDVPEILQWSNATPTTKVLLRRIRPEHNERRFYAIEITSDLFGCLLLSRNWGRIDTAGRLRFDLHTDAESARIALKQLAKAKLKRGYKPLTLRDTP